eukprot:6707745-Lingulodinium_polyedra.AAC.1
MVRASVPHCGTLERRIARSTASLCSVFQKLHNDAVERAVWRPSAPQCGTLARAVLAPSMERAWRVRARRRAARQS